MKACLNCQTEYQPKRDTSKFCSDKCRVSYNRKNPKKGAVTPIQMQVLYNAVLDILGDYKKDLPKDFQNVTKVGLLKPNGTIQTLKPPKTMAQYFEAKRECTCEDDYHSWVAEVDADPYLGFKQKQILKTTNPSNL